MDYKNKIDNKLNKINNEFMKKNYGANKIV